MSDQVNPSKRAFLLSSIAAASLVAVPAFAISTSNAKAFVERMISDLEALASSGKSGGALVNAVGSFMRKYADVRTIARAVIGAPWRGMSGSQQSNYVAAFDKYISSKYGSQFALYKGGKAKVSGVRDGGKAGALVDVEFLQAGKAPRKLQIQVSDGSGSAKILDIKIEGVSLISTEREQVRSLLGQNGGNVDRLIAALGR